MSEQTGAERLEQVRKILAPSRKVAMKDMSPRDVLNNRMWDALDGCVLLTENEAAVCAGALWGPDGYEEEHAAALALLTPEEKS